VELDIQITPALKQEGIKREIIRFVNLLRKDLNLSLNDHTTLYLSGGNEEINLAVTKGKADILKDTLSDELSFVAEMPEVLATKEIKIDSVILTLGLTK
jgi:isoleucyl-tRNA synthetase